MPIGTTYRNGTGEARRAGALVTLGSLLVAATTVGVVLLAAPGPIRTTGLIALVAAAFGLAAWRAVRARRDPTAPVGARSLTSWSAAFAWAVSAFSVLVTLAAPAAPGRAALTGVLAGCLLVLVGRLAERRATGR